MSGFSGNHAVIEEINFSVNGDRDRHARDVLFPHQRLDRFVDDIPDRRMIAVLGRLATGREREEKQE